MFNLAYSITRLTYCLTAIYTHYSVFESFYFCRTKWRRNSDGSCILHLASCMDFASDKQILVHCMINCILILLADRTCRLNIFKVHPVGTSFFKAIFKRVYWGCINVLLWQTVPSVGKLLREEVQMCVTTATVLHRFSAVSSSWSIFSSAEAKWLADPSPFCIIRSYQYYAYFFVLPLLPSVPKSQLTLSSCGKFRRCGRRQRCKCEWKDWRSGTSNFVLLVWVWGGTGWNAIDDEVSRMWPGLDAGLIVARQSVLSPSRRVSHTLALTSRPAIGHFGILLLKSAAKRSGKLLAHYVSVFWCSCCFIQLWEHWATPIHCRCNFSYIVKN